MPHQRLSFPDVISNRAERKNVLSWEKRNSSVFLKYRAVNLSQTGREVVVGRKAGRAKWMEQRTVVLRKYVREIYSEKILKKVMDGDAKVFVDGEGIDNLGKRISPRSKVLVKVELKSD